MAHVLYNKILTHSHTTPGLSCHFSIYIFLFWGGAQSLLGIATLLANLGIMLILLYIVGEKFRFY